MAINKKATLKPLTKSATINVKKTKKVAVKKEVIKKVAVKKSTPKNSKTSNKTSNVATPKSINNKKTKVTKIVPKKTIDKPASNTKSTNSSSSKIKTNKTIPTKSNQSNKKSVVSVPVKKTTPAKTIQPKTTPNNTKKIFPILEKKPKIIPPIKKIVHKEETVKIAKLPKLSTEKSIPYNPSYTPLDRREFIYEKNQNIVRYSDNELQEFKAIIHDKMETAKKELAFLQGFISRKEEMGDDGETGRYITIEDGGAGIERERLSEMAARQIKFIDQLEKALIRIENKTYGVCRVTGKLISKERLRLVPHATLSVDAKLGLVK